MQMQPRICLHRNLPAFGEFQCFGQMLGTILHWRSGGPTLQGSSAGAAMRRRHDDGCGGFGDVVWLQIWHPPKQWMVHNS